MSQASPSPTPSPPAAPEAIPGARAALFLLLAINLFNYLDRYILAALLPRIEADFLINDPNAKTKLGLLTTAFLVAYMLLSPLFGLLGDRMPRWWLIAIGVVIWSLASGASGLASLMAGMALGYWVLLITRSLVGVGEAAYGPVAPTLISDLFPVRSRGQVLSVFYAAIPVGSALGFVIGGSVGWPWAFYLVVPPGIGLGLLCLFMREPSRGQADPGASSHRALHWREYMILFKIPSYVLNNLGMTAMTFAVGGISVWMPTYVYEREGRCQITAKVMEEPIVAKMPEAVKDYLSTQQKKEESLPLLEFQKEVKKKMSNEEWEQHGQNLLDVCCTPSLGTIGTTFGAIVAIAGLTATLLGGWLSDALRKRFPGSYFLVSGISMFIGFPMVLLVLYVDFPLAWVFVFLSVFFLLFNTGPTNTVLANVTHPAIRSTGFALNILIIHVFGDAFSPFIMGFIADRWNMDVAFGAVSAVVLLGGVFWLWGVKYLERDTALAATRL